MTPIELRTSAISAGFAAEAIQALNRGGLLLFRDVPCDSARFLEIASMFGELETVRPPQHRRAGDPFVRLQSNIKGVGVKGGGTYWHADSPWYDPPAAATLLLCEEAPSHGGLTHFVDMRLILAALPDDLRIVAETATALYPCRAILQAEEAAMSLNDPELAAMMHDIRRPLIRHHPRTGQRALYLNEKWLTAIEGLTPDESDGTLRRIYDAIERVGHRYSHAWCAGDLLIWDNAIICHKADSAPVEFHKITWRAIVKSFDPNSRPGTGHRLPDVSA